MDDCRCAIDCDASNVKAHFRGAKASFYMKLWKQSLRFCNEGLEIDKNNGPLLALRKQARDNLENQERQKDEERRQYEPQSEKEKQKRLNEIESAYQKRSMFS